MVLGKLPVPGRPTIWMIVGQGPLALAVGAVGVDWTFLLSSIISILFLPLFGRRPDIDRNTISKGCYTQKQPTNQHLQGSKQELIKGEIRRGSLFTSTFLLL